VGNLASAATVSIKMVSMKEKAQCVFWFYETKSPLSIKRNFRREYGLHPPDIKTSQVGNVGNAGYRERTERPGVCEENFAYLRAQWQAFGTNGCVYAHKKCNSFKPWSQTIIPDLLLFQRFDSDNDHLTRVCFSDEATFHTSVKVNRHNVRI
jgi:hypothetical protein